jgi:hypothetical protein
MAAKKRARHGQGGPLLTYEKTPVAKLGKTPVRGAKMAFPKKQSPSPKRKGKF